MKANPLFYLFEFLLAFQMFWAFLGARQVHRVNRWSTGHCRKFSRITSLFSQEF
jgi:hypothetical protein